jgi:hypothetical protein
MRKHKASLSDGCKAVFDGPELARIRRQLERRVNRRTGPVADLRSNHLRREPLVFAEMNEAPTVAPGMT